MTIRELAELAQVSPATVSIVLNNKKGVSAETRMRILNLAKEHNYDTRKNSRRKVKDVLLLKFWGSGMLVEENQSFVSTIVDSIGSELRLHNHRLSMHIEKNSLEEMLREVDFDSFCAVIVVGTEITRDLYQVLDSIPIPYVMVDNTGLGMNCASVNLDNSSNVYTALAYLKEMGHREIGYLRSAVVTENVAERNDAFQKWTKLLGFQVWKEAEFFLTPTLKGAYLDMRTALGTGRRLPSCLYADNDTVAIGGIKALKECGFSVPKDVSVIAMDDIPFASVSSPPLTTVRVQKEMIGQIAVARLLALLQNPEQHHHVKTLVTGELVIRSSVADLSK